MGKPTDQEIYDIKVPNANMDIIDSNIKKLQDADRNFATKESLQEHTGNQNNPHGVTKQQIGLDKVVNRQQIYGIPGTVTAGGIPVFDGNGYTVRDSGFTIGKSVPPNAAFTDTTYGIADENVPGIIKSSDSIQVSSDGTASVIDDSHSHDAQYYAKAEANRLFFLNSNISQNNENEATRVPSCALLHEIIQQKDQQIQSLKNEISALNSNLARKTVIITPNKLIDRITFRKSGNVVTAILGVTTEEITTMSQTLEIGKAPEGYIPISIAYTMINLTLNSVPAYFAISASGNIFMRVRGNIQANVTLYATFTYII